MIIVTLIYKNIFKQLTAEKSMFCNVKEYLLLVIARSEEKLNWQYASQYIPPYSLCHNFIKTLYLRSHWRTIYLFVFLKYHLWICACSSAIIYWFQLELRYFYSHFSLPWKMQHKICSLYNIKCNTWIKIVTLP